MASQRLTIAKIGGRAADETRRVFLDWNDARISNDPMVYNREHFPSEVRNTADDWAEDLREHGHEPPVIFFLEYIDLWSFSPPVLHLENHGLIEVVGNQYELYFLELPLTEAAAVELVHVRDHGQYNESRFFATVTLHAAEEWSALVDRAVLIFLRNVVAGSVEDKEITASLKIIPEWVRTDPNSF